MTTRILYLHGRALRSWHWLFTFFDQTWFCEAVQAQPLHACTANLVVGSSVGGVIAIPQVRTGG